MKADWGSELEWTRLGFQVELCQIAKLSQVQRLQRMKTQRIYFVSLPKLETGMEVCAGALSSLCAQSYRVEKEEPRAFEGWVEPSMLLSLGAGEHPSTPGLIYVEEISCWA